MKNRAQAIPNQAMDSTENLLTLPPGGSVKAVFVQVTKGVVGFSLSPDGPFSFTGLTWQLDPEYGLFINFNFVPSSTGEQITDLTYKTPLFWLSDVTSTPLFTTQSCCVPAVAGTYKFFVNTPNGRVDPKIVVTPL